MNRIEFTRFTELDYSAYEALNTLCMNLTFLGKRTRIIMTTSCHASEGKSFVTMNMMRTFARLGKRVALVDADLRRSVILAKYGGKVREGSNYGLTHYLAGMCSKEDVLYATNLEGAYIVPVGREVSNSLALLTTEKLGELFKWLQNSFDFILVDAPPVGVIIDAAEIAKSCDGVLFVVNYNTISRRELLEAKQQIERTGCEILGSVLNNVSVDSYMAKKYYYRSYYSRYEGEEYRVRRKSANLSGKKSAPERNGKKTR